MDSRLPVDLAYLTDTMAYLLSLDLDEIDESTDTSLLIAAMKQRVEGLSGRATRKRLREDAQQLRKWLATRPEHPGHFVLAYMESADGLVPDRPIDEPPTPKAGKSSKTKRISMDTPKGFTASSIKGMLCLMNEAARSPVPREGACGVTVMCLADPLVAQSLAIIDQQSGNRGGTPVAFGEWSGRKDCLAGRVFYHLRRAEVNVQLVVQAKGAWLEEPDVEAVLASIVVA